MKISLNQQIEEVSREMEQRGYVYPRLASKGRERQSVLNYQTERMTAVLRTLEWLRDNEAKIKSTIGAQPA